MSDEIFSNISVGGKRLTWKEAYEEEHVKNIKLAPYKRFFDDLNRNENGRHRGDSDSYTSGGVSQGNTCLETGQVVGYSISGRRLAYVVPEQNERPTPQEHYVTFWTEQPEDGEPVSRTFAVYPTGGHIPDRAEYRGTAIDDFGLVLHLYEIEE